jgi:iron complex transport system substrate-binding protein
MARQPLVLVIALALLAGGGAWLAAWLVTDPKADPATSTKPRIVSLMPPITDTLYQIGAGDLVVGRSDYCEFPPQVESLPSCGTTLHPNLEAIARLEPTLVVGENSVQAARAQLGGLAEPVFLPWLTRDEVLASTRELGRLTGHSEAANRLADELSAALPQSSPAGGPRVLLAMPHQPGQMHSVWFLRRNCLHGSVLYGAGARNAVEEDIAGTPSLSLERVLQLDPDVVVILSAATNLAEADRDQLITDWRKLSTLRAARENRIGVLHGRLMYPAGRDILTLIEILRAEIARLRK